MASLHQVRSVRPTSGNSYPSGLVSGSSRPRHLRRLNCHIIDCRPVRAARRLCAQPVNVAAGRPPVPPQPPSSSSSSASLAATTAAKIISSPSLPAILSGVSGGILLGAAALHLQGGSAADHAPLASAAASAVAQFAEFGPGDLIAQNFGPTRPLWSALLHSHPHPHSVATGGDAATAAASLVSHAVSEAHAAVEDASEAARGAVGGLCDDYNRWLQESPLLCKIVTGNFFTVAGDMLAQLGLGGGGGHGGGEAQPGPAEGRAPHRRVDLMRTGRLCLETSVIGTPLGHWWFNLLDSRIMPEDPHCPAAVMTKMLADQVLFAPLGLLMFFAVIKCLEGRPRDLPHTLRTSYVKALLGGYLLWPVAGILNFALLPNEYRLLFNNCVNIIWTCFLSIMSSGDGTGKKPTGAAVEHGGIATASTPAPACADAASIAAAIETAVLVAAISAAALGRPSFGYVTGLAVAAVEAALSAAGASDPEASVRGAVPVSVPVSAPPSPQLISFSAGASVAVGGPCLEVCEQPVDALYEIR